jgi:hypothetical protein
MNVPSSAENEDTEFQLLGLPVNDDSHALRSREPFELLVSQFVDELRHGKKPSVELYARRFPPHAARIRDVFPVLAMLEHTRIAKEAQSIRRNMPDRFRSRGSATANSSANLAAAAWASCFKREICNPDISWP